MASCAKFFLYSVNTLVFLVGAAIFALSIFVAVAGGDVLNALGEAGVVGPVVAGTFLLLTSLIGCIGVCCRSKFLTIIYVLMTTALSAAFIGVGALFTFVVKDLGNTEGELSADFRGTVEGQINDFLIAVFNQCCSVPFNLDRLLDCEDPQADPNACFTFIETYQAALDRVLNSALCLALESLEVEGEPIVGNPANSDISCGGDGGGAAFKAVMNDFVEALLVPVGSSFLAFGVILLLTMIATVCVVCKKQDEIFDEEYKGNEMAFGSSPAAPAAPPAYASFGNNNGMNNPKYRSFNSNIQ